jgi:hypothetical protein
MDFAAGTDPGYRCDPWFVLSARASSPPMAFVTTRLGGASRSAPSCTTGFQPVSGHSPRQLVPISGNQCSPDLHGFGSGSGIRNRRAGIGIQLTPRRLPRTRVDRGSTLSEGRGLCRHHERSFDAERDAAQCVQLVVSSNPCVPPLKRSPSNGSASEMLGAQSISQVMQAGHSGASPKALVAPVGHVSPGIGSPW